MGAKRCSQSTRIDGPARASRRAVIIRRRWGPPSTDARDNAPIHARPYQGGPSAPRLARDGCSVRVMDQVGSYRPAMWSTAQR
jgi:hypothetical protein